MINNAIQKSLLYNVHHQIMRLSLLALVLSTALISFSQVKKESFDQIQDHYLSQSDTTYVVNFWATWCKPCVEELPEFQEALTEYHSEKVKFMFVSLDFPDSENRVNAFINKRSYTGDFFLLTDTDANSWIPKIDADWDGNIPVTLIVNSTFRYFQNGKMTLSELKSQIDNSLKK